MRKKEIEGLIHENILKCAKNGFTLGEVDEFCSRLRDTLVARLVEHSGEIIPAETMQEISAKAEKGIDGGEPKQMSIKSWGLEAGLHFLEMFNSHVDFKRKFRVVLEHDPENPTDRITFYYPEN